MVGGHGTAGAFGPVLEDFGVAGATTLCTAAATYGLIAGGVMGGPTGRLLIERRKLLDTVVPEDDSLLVEEEIKHERHTSMYPAAVFQLIIAIGIGTFISKALAMTGLTFPIYIGAMIAAACMRNIGEFTHKFTTHMGEINDIGGISLSLFLGIAMITLKLWQLAALALPLIILLAGQTLLIFLFTYFVIFNIMGRDYDAAVIAAGVCGWHGRDAQRHGQHAGPVRKVCPVGQGVSADPAGRQSVCGLPQQSGHHLLYQLYLIGRSF